MAFGAYQISGEKLKAMRIGKFVTQLDAAQIVGIAEGRYRLIEKNRSSRVTASTFRGIAKLIQESPEEALKLLSPDPNPSNASSI